MYQWNYRYYGIGKRCRLYSRMCFRKYWAKTEGLCSIGRHSWRSNHCRQFNMKHKSHVVVAHPVNPPYNVPLVDVVPAPWTKPEMALKTKELMLAVGQKPVLFTREIERSAVNRVQWVFFFPSISSRVLYQSCDVSDSLNSYISFLCFLSSVLVFAEIFATDDKKCHFERSLAFDCR